jgi:hypothetical protein
MSEIVIGQKVRLKGIHGQIQEDELEVISVGKSVVTVKNKDGVNLSVHRTRIAEISSDLQTTQVIESEPKPATESVRTNKVKDSKPVPFDLDQWVKEHGGIHLSKQVTFDHAGYECTSHIVIDEPGGVYYTLNVYKYPDGTVSRGKNGAGGNKFQLGKSRGKQVSADDLIKTKLKKGYKLLTENSPQ